MKWRRWRSRFGISAPRVAIRPHVPWYWRALATTAMLAIALVLAHWIYDAGRNLAGFQWRESEEELTSLRTEVARLKEDNDQLRKVVNVSDSSLQIEQTAQQRLTQQTRRLETENGQLKEELAVFESLAGGGSKSSAADISRLALEPEGPIGGYRYRVLLTSGGSQGEKELTGTVQMVITGVQGGKTVMLTLPRVGEKEARVSFRRFLRHSGVFRLPADLHIKEAEARLLVGGAVVATTKISL